jgi:hypothetical protein
LLRVCWTPGADEPRRQSALSNASIVVHLVELWLELIGQLHPNKVADHSETSFDAIDIGETAAG